MKQAKRRIGGFTMAELLIVVAIMTVLAGVGFIAVQNHQKSLTQLEMDNAAKELFIAAQNHLSLAESQGYLSVEKSEETFGVKDSGATSEAWIITSVKGSGFGTTGANMLDLMLPFGAIDDTVRVGGSYIIRYQANPARVLEVFYWADGSKLDYSTLKALDAAGRKNYKPIVGYYGVEGVLEVSNFSINAPAIEVKNAERLTVEVTPNNAAGDVDGLQLKLIVKGENATAIIPLLLNSTSQNHRVEKSDDKFIVTLDDVTHAYSDTYKDGWHFAELNNAAGFEGDSNDAKIDLEGTFTPGENITISAVAFSNTALTNIAYSNEWTTNSLFADITTEFAESGDDSTTTKAAIISNIRHLENLDEAVSGLNNEGHALFNKALQSADLAWSGSDDDDAFTSKIPNARVYKLNKEDTGTEEGTFLPVSPAGYALEYESGIKEADTTANDDARYYTITGIKVGTTEKPYAEDAGLFGKPTMALTVSNLELIDFEINGAKSAGALAGNLPTDSSVTNVLARNYGTGKETTIKSSGASAGVGGLIGEMTGTTVSGCASALAVSGTGSGNGSALGDKAAVGGLVGKASSGSIANSYSAGHTDRASYYTGTGAARTAIFNISSNGNAGGLVGVTDGATITNCYSTCSVKGATAGGLVGVAGGDIANSYATGLVLGVDGSAKLGAFASSMTGTASDCYYYEIINESMDENDGTFVYMNAVDGNEAFSGIKALDADIDTFNDFCDKHDEWVSAKVYDSTLTTYYNNGETPPKAVYPLRSIASKADEGSDSSGDTDEDSDPITTPADFVAVHYGDWPAPEIFVVNTPSS